MSACSRCDGTGIKGKFRCSWCNGTGEEPTQKQSSQLARNACQWHEERHYALIRGNTEIWYVLDLVTGEYFTNFYGVLGISKLVDLVMDIF